MRMKRWIAFLCAAAMIFLAACSPAATEPTPSAQIPEDAVVGEGALPQTVDLGSEADEPLPTEEPEEAPVNPAQTQVGIVMMDDGSLLRRCALHGFLRTAENLGYPAKLYTADSTAAAAARITEAVNDGCKGLLIWAEDSNMEGAVRQAVSAGITVVTPYYETDSIEGVGSNLAPEPADFCAEAARIMCEQAQSRGVETGVIALVREAGAHQDIVDAFTAAVAANYPQYTVSDIALSSTEEESTEAARAFVKEHADIAGIWGLSPTSATAWYNGEIAAEKELKAEKAENAKRVPVIMGLDYTKENLNLVTSGKIYALIARPFYNSTAQSMMMLDSILHGNEVQEHIRLNAPVIRNKDSSKYSSIVSEVESWFGM